MRAALLLVLAAGCGGPADLVLELRRAVPTTQIGVGVCDAEHPDDCIDAKALAGGTLTSELGIYLDGPISPPLSIRLFATPPVACGVIEIDPTLAPDRFVVQFPSMDNDALVVERCDRCRLVACPPP